MKDTDPKSLWDELRQAFDDWMGVDPEQADDDPSMLFHLLFTVPLVMGLIVMLRRAT
jgi:hypothetical protein